MLRHFYVIDLSNLFLHRMNMILS